ncbi:hypothetical protein WM40_22020 [Robbsia andropogonis]|uniref:Ornithine carbamoyltransferase n=2 Tax=Robbsia andropogonis TaxID=28092 RepID=A0A0F5JWK7_9BURK|nr:hypothetical protein [Robbsia andropogonis]KKB61637.1 hypothetical protein WM40_22020 [Robbsia andropogonis]MCP1116720.1 ornithine carbamoyltransferase [Robbsia andropogonis]MCP1126601.1 ornithine carbamoyltransferase [Robbsia andropogonis]
MLIKRMAMWSVIGAMVASIAACAPLTRSQKGAAIGGAAGGALGYVLTGGPIGTIAGAAAGGLIGAGAGR